MSEQILLCVFILVLVGVSAIALIWQLKLQRLQKKRRLAAAEFINGSLQQSAKNLADWQEKVAQHRHLLTGKSWRDPDGKKEFVAALYDGIPDYLWYALNDDWGPDELADACSVFWQGGLANNLGDMKIHCSDLTGFHFYLRIRNSRNFVDQLIIGEHVGPLCQVGCSALGGTEVGCVNFIDLFEEKS